MGKGKKRKGTPPPRPRGVGRLLGNPIAVKLTVDLIEAAVVAAGAALARNERVRRAVARAKAAARR